MAEGGLPMVLMGRGAWQKLAEPNRIGNLMFEMGDITLYAWSIIISGAFVLFGLCLSCYLLFDHLSGYNNPKEQKWLIGIILMVPIYAVTSFLSLWIPRAAIYFDIMGNCYEAFALYSFGRYLIACLGGEEMAIQRLGKQGLEGIQTPLLDEENGNHFVVHPIPFTWFLQPWELGRQFYDTAKFGIVQYMIIKVSCSWAALILSIIGKYGDGEFNFRMGYPYITLIQNFSQMWALYCLIQFYYVTKHELQEINPLAKFLCFKAVVFVTWWQGVVIAILFATGLASKWLPFKPSEEKQDMLQTGLQGFIICIEMAFAAVAHIYIYPATPYQHVSKQQNFNKVGSVADQLEEDIEVAATSVKESIQDVVLGGGGHVVEDVKVTMSQAVEPVETGITNLNEAFQENVSRINDKLHDHVSKINETFQEKVQQWGGKQTSEITKEGTYLVHGEEQDDPEIVQSQERFSVERDAQNDESSESSHSRDSRTEGGVVKEEVSGRTIIRSANKAPAGQETVSFSQRKEVTGICETKESTTATIKENKEGKLEKEEKLSISERLRRNSEGRVLNKETKAHQVERNSGGEIVSDIEEWEETDNDGERVKKDIYKKEDNDTPSSTDTDDGLSRLREDVQRMEDDFLSSGI